MLWKLPIDKCNLPIHDLFTSLYLIGCDWHATLTSTWLNIMLIMARHHNLMVMLFHPQQGTWGHLVNHCQWVTGSGTKIFLESFTHSTTCMQIVKRQHQHALCKVCKQTCMNMPGTSTLTAKTRCTGPTKEAVLLCKNKLPCCSTPPLHDVAQVRRNGNC